MASEEPQLSKKQADLAARKVQVHKELEDAGVPALAFRISAEARYLYKIIHTDEHVLAVVIGHADIGMAMLVATNHRLIFLNKKPLFTQADDIAYSVVTGVSHGQVGLFSTVVLHTKTGDFTLTWAEPNSTRKFVRYVEDHCLEQ